jgi:hypothetical protein
MPDATPQLLLPHATRLLAAAQDEVLRHANRNRFLASDSPDAGVKP